MYLHGDIYVTGIKHFTNEDFNGNRLYVTRARESFLERLQREREQVQKKVIQKVIFINILLLSHLILDTLAKNKTWYKIYNIFLHLKSCSACFQCEPQELPRKNPVIKLNEKLNPRKRKFETQDDHLKQTTKHETIETIAIKKPEIQKHFENDTYHLKKHPAKTEKPFINNTQAMLNGDGINVIVDLVLDKKKLDSEMKRMESMKRKRQEYKNKKMIIKTGLTTLVCLCTYSCNFKF